MSYKFIELSSYDIPKAKVDKKKDWVAYGDNNDFFQRLLDACQSVTHGSLTNSITDLVYGRGLYATDAARNPEGYASMVSLFSETTMRCIAEDYYKLGWAMLQIIYNKEHDKIVEVYHSPAQNYRAEKANEDGDIEAYYYADDWTEVKGNTKPKRIPAFGMSKEGLEVLCIKPYRSGEFYYSTPEYFSALPYADLEINLAKYHNNNVNKKFSGNIIINFNNGQPDEDKKFEIERKVKSKFEGVEGETIIVAFNDNKEAAATVETIAIPDAHSQYDFLSREAREKIMQAHRITSPILVGLGGGGGLGSNADELRVAMTLFDNQFIKPMQRVLLEGVQKVLTFNGVSLNAYFASSQPIEVQGLEVEDVASTEEATDLTGVELPNTQGEPIPSDVNEDLIQKEASYNGAQIASALEIMRAVAENALSQDQAITFLIQMLQFDPSVARALFSGASSAIITQMKSQLKVDANKNLCCSKHEGDNLDQIVDEFIALGEDEDADEWELISESEVDYPLEDADDREEGLFAKIMHFVTTGTAKPGAKSKQDKGLFKVRYQYAPKSSSANSREFCRKMVAAGKVYRKEDIIAMGDKAVNPGWGPRGANTYSIWYYKGGGNCHHYWMRKVYMRKRGAGGEFLPNEGLKNDKEVSVNEARKAGVPLAKNDEKVAKLPADMPNNGFLPK